MKNKLAKELIKLAKEISALEEISYYDFMDQTNDRSVKGMIEFAKNHGGSINMWKLGDGWKYVIRFGVDVLLDGGGKNDGESSELCVLYALTEMCKDFLNINPKLVTDADLSNVEEYKVLCRLPRKWGNKEVKLLIDDLEDINYHSVVKKLGEIKQIEEIMEMYYGG